MDNVNLCKITKWWSLLEWKRCSWFPCCCGVLSLLFSSEYFSSALLHTPCHMAVYLPQVFILSSPRRQSKQRYTKAILCSKNVKFEHCYTSIVLKKKKQGCKQISYVNIQENKDFYLFKREHDVQRYK